MRWLWWVFATFYIGHVFPLIFLTTLRLPRNVQLIVQVVLSIGALYFSYEMSLLLLLFTFVHAFLRTLDWTDRYALASGLFLLIDWLFPPASQPLTMVAFPFLFLIWRRSLYYRRDYKRMVSTLLVGLGLGLATAMMIRTVKELIFGDFIAWIRPFFIWFGGWFDGIVVDQEDRVNRFRIPSNPNLDGETIAQETLLESASNESLFLIGFFLTTLFIGVALFIYLQKRKEVQDSIVLPKRTGQRSESDKRVVRSPRHIRLLETGRRLERAHPRNRQETAHDWLERINFTDHAFYAQWLEAAEYGEKDAPQDVIESFGRRVEQRIKK